MKQHIWLILVLFSTASLVAQSTSEALRYSYVAPLGSARFAGTGGSLTPMGTDLVTLHTNPAGIGANRYSQAYASGGFSFNSSINALTTDISGSSDNSSTATLTLPSAGVLVAGNTRSVNWSTFNYGLSVTRLADFNQQSSFTGSSTGSISNAIVIDLNDVRMGVLQPQDIITRAGLFPMITGTLYLDEDNLNTDLQGYFSPFDFDDNLGKPIRKSGELSRSGSMHELAFGVGGSYKDKFSWGLSLGIPFSRFSEEYRYEEIDEQDDLFEFDNSIYSTFLESDGTGVNFKFGLIYKPTESTRVSGAIHSPTFWSIDETFNSSLTYNITIDNELLGGSADSDQFISTYNLTTPWRYMFGAGILIGQKGFVSVDGDYTNYAGNSVSFDDFATISDAQNENIDDQLKSSIAVRVGGELNLKPFQVRAGVGYRQLPYAEDNPFRDKGILSLSTGLGYSRNKFFVDLAVQVDRYQDSYLAYDVFVSPPEDITTDRSRISGLLTVGVRGWNAGF